MTDLLLGRTIVLTAMLVAVALLAIITAAREALMAVRARLRIGGRRATPGCGAPTTKTVTTSMPSAASSPLSTAWAAMPPASMPPRPRSKYLRERLERQTGTPEDRLREAIALANNDIYRQARSQPEWNGMACVLTVALIEDDIVTVGHVGDSRLYLLRPGEIHKITHDHSPVGEREDRGETHRRRGHAARAPQRDLSRRGVERTRPGRSVRSSRSSHFPMPADGAHPALLRTALRT